MPAVATPPAPKPAPPAPAPVEKPAPIENFEPPSFEMPVGDDDVSTSVSIPAPAPTKRVPEPTPTPGGPTPPAPKPLSKEEQRQKNSDIRAQLEEANRKAREAEERIAQIEQERQERIAALEKERDELNGRYTETSTKYAELNKTLSMENPLQSEEVQSVLEPWNQRVRSIAKDISDTGGNGKLFNSVLPEMVQTYRSIGEEGTEGYEQRREAFNNLVGQFPDHAKEIRELVRNGLDVQSKAQNIIRELQTNGETFRFSREKKMWDAIANDFAKDEAKFFSPAPELRETDPFNVEVLVTELLSGSDEGKKRMEQIKKFTRFTTLPLPPVDPSDLAKMTNEDAVKFLEGRQVLHQQNQLKLRRLLPTALAAQALLPSLMKRNQELEEQLAAYRGETPSPKPSSAGGKDDDDAGDAPITSFTPSNKTFDEFKGKR